MNDLKKYIKQKIKEWLKEQVISYVFEDDYRKLEKAVKSDIDEIVDTIYNVLKDDLVVELRIIHVYYGSKDVKFTVLYNNSEKTYLKNYKESE